MLAVSFPVPAAEMFTVVEAMLLPIEHTLYHNHR